MGEPQQSPVTSLAVRYERVPTLRALLSLVPYWSVADTLMLQRAEEVRQERVRAFFDELALHPERLNEEVIQGNEFIHCFLRTTEAVLKTRREEKIRYFARLLIAATRADAFSDIDEFEDLLDVLVVTSMRELGALVLLRSYEQEGPGDDGEERNKALIAFWPRFREEACQRLSIPADEFPGFMTRLERTSLYTSSLGMVWGATGEGITTPQFARLASLVLRSEDLGGTPGATA